MKKIFLLLIVLAVTLNSGAQELHQATANAGAGNIADATVLQHYIQQRYIYQKHGAEKTTIGGSRWYFYGDAIDTSQEYQNVIVNGNPYQPMFFGETTIWNDTNGTVLDPILSYHHMTRVCEGSVFDPKVSLFNTDPDEAYLGQIWVEGPDAYIWDSVSISGRYLYNSTKTSVVDTLRLVFVTGAGGAPGSDDIFKGVYIDSLGHYHTDTFLSLIWDSVTNTATTHTYAATYTRDILLTSADWHDTTAGGFWDTSIATNGATGISVGASALCGMSITFISGDPATKGAGLLANPTPGDTLVSTWSGSGNNKYNVWQPLIAYYQSAGGTAMWAPFQCPFYEPSPKDNNLGYWKNLPNTIVAWDDEFEPTWAWKQGTGASDLQYPYIGYHVVCVSCSIIGIPIIEEINNVTPINNIKAFPDPAINELNISFDLSVAGNVSVSLTNMLGQVVATQNVNNIETGKAVFNTAILPAGVYVYTLKSNGSVTTGRVAITH